MERPAFRDRAHRELRRTDLSGLEVLSHAQAFGTSALETTRRYLTRLILSLFKRRVGLLILFDLLLFDLVAGPRLVPTIEVFIR